MLTRTPVQTYPILNVAIAAVGDWIKRHHAHRDQSLDACDSAEIARMAHDVGVSEYDLRQMARLNPDAANLVLERLKALHLFAEEIAANAPGTMRDLQRLCSNCASKKRCQRDLAHNASDLGWRQYCPNAGTLGLLQEEAAAH
jgi:hypothetical protein